MSDFTIRDAAEQDLDSLRELWRHLESAQGPIRVFPLADDAESKIDEYNRETIAGADGRLLVAESDGDGLVGMATVWFWVGTRHLDPMPIIDLSRVVVRPDWRGRGVGGALIAEAEAWGREKGARYLQAHMFAGNDDGRAFWERRGFVPRYEARVRPILPADG